MTARIDVIGYLGKVTTGTSSDGKPYLRSSVAHSTRYKNAKGEEVESRTWYNFTLWHDKAVERYSPKLATGDLIHIAGEPHFRAYQNGGELRADFSVNIGFGGTFEVLRYKDSLLAKEKTGDGDTSADDAMPF